MPGRRRETYEMDQFATSIESELIDLTDVSLADLRDHDGAVLAQSLARLIVEASDPSSSVGGDAS